MNEFDQFVKNLVESGSPEYEERHWKQFARKAGFKIHTFPKVAAAVLAGLAIASASFWMGTRFAGPGGTAALPAEEIPPPAAPLLLPDTLLPERDTVEELPSPVAIAPSPLPPAEKRLPSLPKSPAPAPRVDTPHTPTPAIHTPHPSVEKRTRRTQESFYFNVDTIRFSGRE